MLPTQENRVFLKKNFLIKTFIEIMKKYSHWNTLRKDKFFSVRFPLLRRSF